MSHILPVYKRADLCFTHGQGAYLFSTEGKKYLDFAAGIAVNAFGHAHPSMVAALQTQVAKLWHVSNLYQIEGLEKLATRLCEHSFADKVFFCNSGAEAIECGIKMVRRYFDEIGEPDRYRIITFANAFHGRTMAAISASGGEKLTSGFGPLLDGFDHVPMGDRKALEDAITKETAAILVEPVLGEGGIIPIPYEFMRYLRELCDKHGLLLFLDEIQCGIGRTGKFYAHEWSGITPDLLASAKGIGNGFPLGACLATEKASQGMKPGTHGSTYGSNPLAVAVGNAVLDLMLEPDFLLNVQEVAHYLHARLLKLQQTYPNIIQEVRGLGLMIGLKLTPPNAEFMAAARDAGLLTAPASDNILRLLPPLIITPTHCDEALEKLDAICKQFSTHA